MAAPDDLDAVMREQTELRLRLSALDRKIEALQIAQAEEIFAAPVPQPEKEIPVLPPPLPVAVPRVIAEEFHPSPTPPRPPVLAAPEKKPSWEFKLGTVWLVRIGIVVLLTGFVFLANYAWQTIVPHLGPGAKLTLLSLLGGSLAGLGASLEKRSAALRNYGRVLLAGGVALLYYATYGASFVEKIRVIESPLLGGSLLLLVGGAILWLAEKRQAQSVALTAILLSYYTSAINPLGLFSLYSSLLLTAAAVFLLLRHRWTTVGFFSLAGTYLSYAFWRYYRGGEIDFSARGDFWHGCGFLFGYWVIFTAAVFLSRSLSFPAQKRTPFLSLNNAAFFALVFQSIHANHPAWDGRFCLAFGGVLLALAALASRRERDDLSLDGAYLMQGLGILTLGLTIELSGYQLSLALAIQGTMMLFGMNRRHGWFYETAAALVSLGAFAVTSTNLPLTNELAVRSALVALFVLDAWLTRYFREESDTQIFRRRTAGYSLLAVLEIGHWLHRHAPPNFQESAYCLATLALLVLAFFLKLRELAIVGQLLAILGIGLGLAGEFGSSSRATFVLTSLILVHWWQRQKEGDLWKIPETIFALLTLGSATSWMASATPADAWMCYLGSLALASLVYGCLTGAFALALAGQLWILWAAGLFFSTTLGDSLPWLWPTLTLGLVTADVALFHFLSERFPVAQKKILTILQTALTAVVFCMICAWGWRYINLPGRMLFFIVFATGLVRLAAGKKETVPSPFLLVYASVATLLGLAVFADDMLTNAAASWLNVAAWFLLAWHEQFSKKRLTLPRILRQLLMLAVLVGLWLELNRWLGFSGSHFPKSLAWALLATASLCAGLTIRERTYRIGGFLLLTAATAHLLFFDVEGLARILCFIALGIVILVLGFIYNRFADKFRDWL